MKHFVIVMIVLQIVVLAGCGGEEADDTSVNNPTPDNSDVAAMVNGQPITRQRLQQEVSAQESYASQAADPATFEAELLEYLINLELIQQYAAQHNIVVTAGDVQDEIELLRNEAASQEVELSQITGYPDEVTETIVYETLIVQAVRDSLIAELPTSTTQVHARHILVNDEATANAVIAQLDSGEATFEELARQFSQDPSTAEAGGDLGWIASNDLLNADIEAAIFALPVNVRYPEPVPSTLGYHIIEVVGRDENRPLTEMQRINQQQRAFEQLIAEQREAADIDRYVGQSATP